MGFYKQNPCKVTLEGDTVKAQNFIGVAKSQLRILINEMSFQGLTQSIRRVRVAKDVFITCIRCFHLDEVIITVLPVQTASSFASLILGYGFNDARKDNLYHYQQNVIVDKDNPQFGFVEKKTPNPRYTASDNWRDWLEDDSTYSPPDDRSLCFTYDYITIMIYKKDWYRTYYSSTKTAFFSARLYISGVWRDICTDIEPTGETTIVYGRVPDKREQLFFNYDGIKTFYGSLSEYKINFGFDIKSYQDEETGITKYKFLLAGYHTKHDDAQDECEYVCYEYIVHGKDAETAERKNIYKFSVKKDDYQKFILYGCRYADNDRIEVVFVKTEYAPDPESINPNDPSFIPVSENLAVYYPESQSWRTIKLVDTKYDDPDAKTIYGISLEMWNFFSRQLVYVIASGLRSGITYEVDESNNPIYAKYFNPSTKEPTSWYAASGFWYDELQADAFIAQYSDNLVSGIILQYSILLSEDFHEYKIYNENGKIIASDIINEQKIKTTTWYGDYTYQKIVTDLPEGALFDKSYYVEVDWFVYNENTEIEPSKQILYKGSAPDINGGICLKIVKDEVPDFIGSCKETSLSEKHPYQYVKALLLHAVDFRDKEIEDLQAIVYAEKDSGRIPPPIGKADEIYDDRWSMYIVNKDGVQSEEIGVPFVYSNLEFPAHWQRAFFMQIKR